MRGVSAEPGASPLFEIRVHGVSGTPPEDMLQEPNVVRVAGDAAAGFYQARSAQSAPQPVAPVEAYSWSGLTSGGKWRALWLLLLPFMLVNVAYYASSAPLSGRGRARRIHSALLRLLALSLTFTFVLGIISVSMDLIAWQYLRPGRDVTQPLLKWLRWEWINLPRRQVALIGAIPVAMVGLLWWLARQTWARTERTSVPLTPAAAAAPTVPSALPATPLADRAMFNGRGPVRKLRAVHVTGGFAVIAGMLLMPAWRRNGDSFWQAAGRGGLLGVLTALVVVLLLVVVALACLPSMTDREGPEEGRPAELDIYKFLPWIALALTVGCGVFLAFSRAFREAWPGGITSGGYTGYSDVVVWLFAVQALLLIASGIASALQRAEGPQAAQAAWAGFAPSVLASVGWLIGGGFAAALMLAVARVLGSPTAANRVNSARDLIVPTPYLWSSAVALGAAAMLIPAAGWLLWKWKQASAALRKDVPRCYANVPQSQDDSAIEGRIAVIARAWSRARLTDRAIPVVGVLTCAVLALVAAAAIGYIISHDWILQHMSWAVTFGVLAMAVLAGLLIQIGRRAYSDQAERRTVGILWDLGTFWPRAVHPLAPPCYSERTLPDLLRRIDYRITASAGSVVLSCHSQGTVIGAATVLQLAPGEIGAVGLLTYGSPLRRLYARIFPAYFGLDALRRINAELSARWLNLYRSSDPIGGFVFADRFGHSGPSSELDWWLVDPVFDRPPGDGSWPPTRAHSDYWADPAYKHAVGSLAARMRDD